MWVDIEGDHVMVNTAIGRVKEENLRGNPHVSLSHHDPENPYDRAGDPGGAWCGSWRVRKRNVPNGPAHQEVHRRGPVSVAACRRARAVMLLIEVTRVRRVVGVEPFRPGVLPEV